VYTTVLMATLAGLVVVGALRMRSRPRPVSGGSPGGLAVTLACAAVLIGLGLAYQRLDADDSYYLGLASDAVAHDTINGREPSTGGTAYQLQPVYPLQGYELLIGSLALLSGLPVATMAHIVIFATVVLLGLLSYLQLFTALALPPPYKRIA